MGHLSVYQRMFVWGIGTLMVIVGAVKIFLALGYHTGANIIDVLLFLGGWAIVIVNEIIFWLRRTQLEIDRDETIKSSGQKYTTPPTILAICPQCRNRIPSESKYCLECGTNLQRQTPTPTNF